MAKLTNPQLQFYSSRREPFRVWTEGDSYAGAAGGAGMPISLRAQGYVVINSGVGASAMTGVRDRLIQNASLIRQCQRLIVWDGSPNDYGTISGYCDTLQEGLNAAGIDFIVIAPAVPYNMGGDYEALALAIRDEFEARWPGKIHDWREAIANTDGVINQDRMLDYPTDSWHLNTTAHDEEAAALAELLP